MTRHWIWMQALGSVRFDLAEPTPAMIDFDAMAIVLARAPRFAGHTEGGVYSVAQHCHEGAYAILRDTGRRDWAAAFLLHDGHEYVIGDLSTPMQDALCHFANIDNEHMDAGRVVRRAIKALKGGLDAAIYTAAGIAWPLDAETAAVVKEYDTRMCRTERTACLAQPPEPWHESLENAVPVVGADLNPWTERAARWRFKDALADIVKARQKQAGRAESGVEG